MSGSTYDPKLSEAGFMDLGCTMMARLDQPTSKARLEAMHPAERLAALQLATAARNYLEVIEGR